MYICTYVHMYIYVYMYICLYVYMYICICISLSLYLSLSLSIYIYIYIYTTIHMCVYIYIYIYIYMAGCRDVSRLRRPRRKSARRAPRLGTEATFSPSRTWCLSPLAECLTGAQEYVASSWKGVPLGSPQGQTLGALLLTGTSVPH